MGKARWIHGDIHPDQLLRRPTGAALLDLDCLRPGAPEEDIASWAADVIALDRRAEFEQASAPIVDGYTAAGGGALDERTLRAWVVRGLAERAAAGIRRLEVDAITRAHEILDAAERIGREERNR